MIWLGVFGFLFAAGGVYFATTSKEDGRFLPRRQAERGSHQREQKERSPAMDRLEDRWDEHPITASSSTALVQ